jgi:hypothetical protein
MFAAISRFLDRASEFIVARKGLLPILGILLVTANLILQFFPAGWLASSNLLLHLGIIVALLGILLAWAL